MSDSDTTGLEKGIRIERAQTACPFDGFDRRLGLVAQRVDIPSDKLRVSRIRVERQGPALAVPVRLDAEPGAIVVPVLVVSNEYDTCAETPPGDAPMAVSALTRSPRRELVMATSSQIVRRSDPCEGMSPHGYLGIEGMVVQRISEWIRTAGGR
jgi:hypothetical protein